MACSVFQGGCYRAIQDSETVTREKELPSMIQIQNLLLTDNTLALDLRVSNPFEGDIWVCYGSSFYGKEETLLRELGCTKRGCIALPEYLVAPHQKNLFF